MEYVSQYTNNILMYKIHCEIHCTQPVQERVLFFLSAKHKQKQDYFSWKQFCLFIFRIKILEKGINAGALCSYANLNIYLPLLIFIAFETRERGKNAASVWCFFPLLLHSIFWHSQFAKSFKGKEMFFYCYFNTLKTARTVRNMIKSYITINFPSIFVLFSQKYARQKFV